VVGLGLIACVLFAFALVSRRLERTIISAPMVAATKEVPAPSAKLAPTSSTPA
jgi:hypothetical protein